METKCNNEPKVKAVILVKKGMAEKAMNRNLQSGNVTKLKGQLNRGTVKIIKCSSDDLPLA